jgi:hypothetical protein
VTARVDGPAERFAAPVPEAAPPAVPTLRSAAARRRTSRRSLVLGVLVVLLGGLVALGPPPVGAVTADGVADR